MERNESLKKKERVNFLKQTYPSFEASVSVPENTQLFLFDALIKTSRNKDLYGIIFPKKDYQRAELSLEFFYLNFPERIENYVGARWDLQHPYSVLELGLEHIDKAPTKIIYDNGQYVFTDNTLLDVSLTSKCLNDASNAVQLLNQELLPIISNAKKLMEHKLGEK